MCGIVAVTGRVDAADYLIDGLRRLEYRGYDSAGLCIVSTAGVAHRIRAVGKVQHLANKTHDEAPTGRTGIAHTRWATHGPATEANAHPHAANGVNLVHNGIIENYLPLRRELEAAGHVFASDTDTEVVAHLLAAHLATGLAPKAALQETVARLEGAFALAIVLDGQADLVMGARRGAPLLAAIGPGVSYLSSDILAIDGSNTQVINLEDGDIVMLRPGEIEITDAAGQLANRPAMTGYALTMRAEKGAFRHFMEKEIYEQPEAVSRTLSRYVDPSKRAITLPALVDFTQIDRLIIVGCGTAAYAGDVAKYWFEGLSGLPVQVDIASEFRYRSPAFLKRDAALFISQSGETADTLEAMRLCKAAGLKTIALVNNELSTMAREADIVMPTLAGPEIGVASTKSFTCQLTALAAIAVSAGVQRGVIDGAAQEGLAAELLGLPRQISAALKSRRAIDPLSLELARSDIVLYLGRNALFPLALEGALKLKEISYIHAEGYASGELKHGPIALIEEGVSIVTLAPKDALFDKTWTSIEQVKARGGRVIAVTDPEGQKALDGHVDLIIPVPAAGVLSTPLVHAVAMQLIAYCTAVHKGTDVDQPRNLAKSVTVE
jgi:glutamine---fructose-6-phosphate transaminase (isomerizing)